MKTTLVIFEHNRHWQSTLHKFVDMISNKEEIQRVTYNNGVIETKTGVYKLVGMGFPYVRQGHPVFDKLLGYRFDNVLIHSDVVLTRYAEDVIKSRMKEIKEFEEFEL